MGDICIITTIIISDNKVQHVNQRGASDSVAGFSELSNPADVQNASCLGLCGKDICPKRYA